MLNKIIQLSLGNKLIVVLLTAVLVIMGVIEATKLPIDAVPDITNNQIQLITTAPSYGATDIERLVTFPIEQVCNNIPGLEEIRSFSRFGLSIVTIVFTDETDIYWARQQISERLLQVREQIPQDIQPPALGPVTTGLGEIFQYVIRPAKGMENQYDVTELRTIQDWVVKRQLLAVEGVAEVSSFGGKLKQYEISIDLQKLQSLNLTIDDVFNSLASNNQNTGGSYIEKGPTLLFIRSEGQIENSDQIGEISIKNSSKGTPIKISDVAEVKIGFATRYGALCYNNDGEVSGGIVMMLKGANSRDVIRKVKDKIEEIKPNLPDGVIIEPYLDRTKMVNNAISTVETNLAEGALIVVFILVMFLGNIRAGFIVASVIPLSMLFAIILMNLFGVSGNLMSLGALDFGLIVDGAVIIVEAVMHRMSHLSNGIISKKNMDIEVGNSSSRMMNSAIFGQLIILIVYLPIFSLEGIEGKMFKPMAQTVAFALIGAFLLSLTYIPVVTSLLLSRKTGPTNNYADRFIKILVDRYTSILKRALKYPKYIITSVILLFIGSVLILTQTGGEFIPALEEGDFAVEARVMNGSNLQTTINETQKAVSILRNEYPEIEKIVTKIGSGEVPTDPMPIDASDMMIILKPKDEWQSAKTFPELAEKMQHSLEAVPGLSTGFQYPVQMRFNELLTGAKQDVVCKIFGDDLDSLNAYAQKLGKVIEKLDGATDIYVEPVEGLPQIVITYQRNMMAEYGISVETANRAIHTALAGQTAGVLYEGDKRFDIVVRLDAKKRKSLEDMQNLQIPAKDGNTIPLSVLALVREVYGPGQIQRVDTRRRIVVGFNVRNKDVQTVVENLQTEIKSKIKLPSGYYIQYGGAFENLANAKKRLMIAVPVSLLFILFLLYLAFNSLKYALLIYASIPLSAIGGILFLSLRGLPFSISAGVGFIALFGVAVLNGLVLVAEFKRLLSEEKLTITDAVVSGTRNRFRPVLMTALVASLGFLPMALSNGAGAEVQRPLATVVIGGLVVSTLLTLIVLPILFIMFEKSRKITVPVKLAVFVLGFLFSAQQTIAQQTLSLDEALLMASKDNPEIKMAQSSMEQKQILKKSFLDVPKTNIGITYGQFNSAYQDFGANISQEFAFPGTYLKQRNQLNFSAYVAEIELEKVKRRVRRQVTDHYISIAGNKNTLNLWLDLDSLFVEFIRKSSARKDAGESLEIEMLSLSAKRLEMEQEIRKLRLLIAEQEKVLGVLTGANFPQTTLANFRGLEWPSDSGSMNPQHPELILQQFYVAENQLELELERSKLWPGISLGYNNNSIQGLGSDNRFYTAKDRFQFVYVGLNIPIFIRPQLARIASAEKQIEMAGIEHLYMKSVLETEYQQARNRYDEIRRNAVTYTENLLPYSLRLEQTAQLHYSNGVISFIEWITYLQQAHAIKLESIQTQTKLLQSINKLQYYEN